MNRSWLQVGARPAIFAADVVTTEQHDALDRREAPAGRPIWGTGGRLNPRGVAEINRRLQAGESDGQIARAMNVTVQGVQARRRRQSGAASQTSHAPFRVWPGGPLTLEGQVELDRRFRSGETDAEIARAMDISFGGVQKRRTTFKAVLAAATPEYAP